MKIKKFSTAMALGLAMSVAAPTVMFPVAAQAADKKAESEQISHEKLPPAVAATMDKVVPPGSKDVIYHHNHVDGKNFFVVAYDPPGAVGKLKFKVNPDGSVMGGAAENPGVDLTPLNAPAPLPTPVPVVVPGPLVSTPAVAVPQAPAGAGDEASINADIAQRTAQIDQLNAQMAGLDQQLAGLNARAATDPNAAAERDRVAAERNRLYVEATRQAVEVSRQEQRIADIEARNNPQLAAQYNPASLQQEKMAGGQWQLSNVPAGEVPAAAYLALLKYTKGQHGVVYSKMTRGTEQGYAAHYLDAQNKRFFVTVAPDGKVLSEPAASSFQPDVAAIKAAAKLPAATATPAAVPAAAGGDTKIAAISGAEVPAAAVKTMEKYTKGAKNEQFRKDTKPGGEIDYVVHYTGADGKKMFVSVKADGTLVQGPAPSNY